jgi:anaerobic C4-dicarboxylate transporter DcuA
MGIGLQLGVAPPLLIAMFPAVNGYFFLPTYATIVAAIQFDSTGTTRVGRWILNHSFMRPGLVTSVVSVLLGLVLAKLIYGV